MRFSCLHFMMYGLETVAVRKTQVDKDVGIFMSPDQDGQDWRREHQGQLRLSILDPKLEKEIVRDS